MVYIDPGLKRVVENQLAERGSRAPGQEERPITTVNMKALHNLQFRATVEGHSFILDEAEHGGGNDAGPAPMRFYAAGIMGADHVWVIKTAALNDLPIDSLEGEFALYGSKVQYTLSVESPNTDDQMRQVINDVRKVRGSVATMAGGRKVEFKLRHNGQTIMDVVYE
jgi:uncharacterized OsmC-like protein